MHKDEFSFSTDIESADVDGLAELFQVPNADIDITRPNVRVEWNLDFDARNSGIKTIYRNITSVICEIEWEVNCVDSELTQDEKDKLLAMNGIEYRDDISGVVIVNSNEPFIANSNEPYNNKTWTIDESEFTFHSDGQCYPTDCEIDFKKMTIKIS